MEGSRDAAAKFSPFVRSFIRRVQNTIALYGLWQPKTRFIVAVSGGPDSLCLLDLLFILSKKHGYALYVAHVNYRLRGRASDLDEQLVRDRAKFYGIPCTVLRPRKKITGNLEAGLRSIRYAFLEKLRQEKKYDLIAVAHNEDDQTETFLLRLLRGSGLQGLAAMRPKQGAIVRPLIETSRRDILRYLEERSLAYRTDRSNDSQKFLRNRLRNKLLPLLEKEYQPQIKKLLATNASLLAEDYAFLESLTPPLRSLKNTGKSVIFSCSELLALPEALVRYELRRLLEPCLGQNPEKSLLDEIVKSLKSTKKKAQTVAFRGLKLLRKGDRVTLFISRR